MCALGAFGGTILSWIYTTANLTTDESLDMNADLEFENLVLCPPLSAFTDCIKNGHNHRDVT